MVAVQVSGLLQLGGPLRVATKMTDAPLISDHSAILARPERPLDDVHLWSTPDFARGYRLEKREENRLLTLFGPFASFRDILSNFEHRQAD